MRLADLKSPYLREKLTVANYTHDRAMRSKQEIVEAHGCFRCLRMAVSILRLDGRGVEEGCSGYGVHAEAEHVEGRKVYRKTERRFARVVRNRLGVKTTRLQLA